MGTRWEKVRLSRFGCVAAAIVALTGCEAMYAHLPPMSCPDETPDRLAAVDWASAPVVDLRVRQNGFSPMVVGLLRDQPYVLRIRNGDDTLRTFAAREFFGYAVVDRVDVAGAVDDAAGCIGFVDVPAGKTAEVRLIALREGRYPFSDPHILDVNLGTESRRGFGTIYVD